MAESLLANQKTSTGLIINLAPTGCVAGKEQSPHIPLSHNEIVDDVAVCMELGVQMVHLHARDKMHNHCANPEPYGRMIESIRALPGGKELIICVTTSGRDNPSFEARSRVLELDGDMKPDMASLTLASMNFKDSASINSPQTIRQLAARMLERKIKPELEIFDVGMVNVALVLLKEGLIQPPIYANVLLGNIATAQISLPHVSNILSSIPQEWTVSLAGIGRTQVMANILGMLYTDGIRIGLEDNLWLDIERIKKATNKQLIQRTLRIAENIGRPLYSREELRTKVLV